MLIGLVIINRRIYILYCMYISNYSLSTLVLKLKILLPVYSLYSLYSRYRMHFIYYAQYFIVTHEKIPLFTMRQILTTKFQQNMRTRTLGTHLARPVLQNWLPAQLSSRHHLDTVLAKAYKYAWFRQQIADLIDLILESVWKSMFITVSRIPCPNRNLQPTKYSGLNRTIATSSGWKWTFRLFVVRLRCSYIRFRSKSFATELCKLSLNAKCMFFFVSFRLVLGCVGIFLCNEKIVY